MKPIWMLTALSALFIACGGDDAPADDNGSADMQNDPGQGNPYGGGQAGGPGAGQGGPGMNPGGPGSGDPSAQAGGGNPYGNGGGAGNPYGNGPGGQAGGPPQPTFDPSLPAGKKQVWTKAKITTQWNGKSAADLLKSFGQPASWKQAQGYTAYIYDKMYVTEKNKKYSKITFAVQPDRQSPGGGKIIAIGLVPNSGTPLRPNAGGQGGGFPGQGAGNPYGNGGGNPYGNGGGGPPQGFPGGGQGGGPPTGYPGQGGGQGEPPPSGFNQGGGGQPQR